MTDTGGMSRHGGPMLILGIDPGRNGAGVVLHRERPTDAAYTVADTCRWSAKRGITGAEAQYRAIPPLEELIARIGDGCIDMACIEYPVVGRSAKTALIQGMGYGMIWSLLVRHGITTRSVNPREVHKLAGATSSTTYARMRGYPVDTPHLADAAVIAEWAMNRA